VNDISSQVLRVTVVEDDPRFRTSLNGLLRNTAGFALASSFESAEPAIAQARKARELGTDLGWDIVVTDIGLPGMSGIEFTHALKRAQPALPVVVLTVFEEPATVFAAICAGADGYLLKSAAAEELTTQLEAIMRGSAPLSAALAGTLMQLVRASASQHAFSRHTLPRDLGLTARQLDVLRLLVDGHSYREIGQQLDISLDTVRSHIRQIYSALQVHSVAEAVTYALRHGLA